MNFIPGFSKREKNLDAVSEETGFNEPLRRDEPGSYLKNHDTPQNAARHTNAINKLAIGVLGVSMSLNCVLAVAVKLISPLGQGVLAGLLLLNRDRRSVDFFGQPGNLLLQP